MSTQPVEKLELRAVEQRRQIHATAAAFTGKTSEAKPTHDVTRNLRGHLFALAMGIGAVSLLFSAMIARRFDR